MDFDSVWKIYPRKVGKTDARIRFDRMIRTKEDFELLQKAIEKYVKYLVENQTEVKYIKHFATFLGTAKAPSWKDWLEEEAGTGGIDVFSTIRETHDV